MATKKEIGPATASDTSPKDSSLVTTDERHLASQTEAASTSTWRRVAGLIWDTAEGDPEYRKYVQRLDFIFL